MQNFTDLNLSEPISRAISELGFTVPSPIQAQALPILLEKPTDFLGLAATGTGKTAAFAIPLLERMDPTKRGVQALILCPTRELAIQVTGQIGLIGRYKGIKALPIYGGAGYGDQIHGLKRGVSIVVGTPGRVVDHLEKGTLVLDQVETLILDEADEMISMGFKEDLENVLSRVSAGKSNTWLFSATMSSEVQKVAGEYLKQPKQVQVNRTEMLPAELEQIYYTTQESNKPEVLCKIIDAAEDFYGIVFCQTKALVIDLNQYLIGRGYRTDCLHGDMDQNGRERTMKSFRERKISILIATDVACRGLDVKDISHVVNYSIPRELDNYVHRIGRTGRNGKSGLALSLVTASHRGLIGRIERMTKSKMKEGKIPTRKEIGMKKIAKTLALFDTKGSADRAKELLTDAWKVLIEEMSKEEIAGRFLTLIHPEIFAEREDAKTIRDQKIAPITAGEGERRREDFGGRRREESGGRRRESFSYGKRESFGHGAGKREGFASGGGKREHFGYGAPKRDNFGYGPKKRDGFVVGGAKGEGFAVKKAKSASKGSKWDRPLTRT